MKANFDPYITNVPHSHQQVPVHGDTQLAV